MEFQKEELDEILNIFQQESAEIISSMDGKLLMLEKGGFNYDIAIQLFRDAHSLKGSARMLGFEEIQNIAHKIEDVISLIKENKLKVQAYITDVISECLEFISDLINKTVMQGTEYKSAETQKYIDRLENIKKETQIDDEKVPMGEDNPFKKDLLEKLERFENDIIELLYIISIARAKKNFDKVTEIENTVNDFISLLNFDDENFSSIKNLAQNIINSLDKYKVSDNKELSFMEVNSEAMTLIEAFCDLLDKENIKRKSYYDIIDEKLEQDKLNENRQDNKQVIKTPDLIELKDEKLSEFIQKIPLLEINPEFIVDAKEIIDELVANEKNEIISAIYKNIKKIIEIFKEKNIPLTHDVVLGFREIIEALKNKNNVSLSDILTKSDVIKTMVKFQFKNHNNKTKKQNELTQKDILNTITNTEIKTLRVDSIKLDNLVGQIGELIVSKIKTNEQLSLAKKINNDLIEWQKNFVKMGYYIKYFDKKYLSNPIGEDEHDFRKIIAYNKQLCALSEQHNEKITFLIKEMSHLFRQIQESEAKLNSTTNEIEEMVKNMRILPLSTIFQLFPRMVHNIARDKNKKIDLIINGADITADKTIIEEIKIPLMHIIRNSIDHGIEEVETRKMLQKNPIGKIEINASYKDNKVVIDVKDDGRGLNIEKIKEKALEKKLLTIEELNAISDEELTNLIFYPGFSTEDFVTELSGRGLGLDIVNNKISQLQGRVDIFSQVNKGTVVRIILPATVATKKVFIIEEQKQLFAIETSVIRTITRINADEVFEKDNNNYYIYNGSAIIIYTLSQILGLENRPRETLKCTLMIIETENTMFGVIVEKLISDQEIVHKKLAPPLYKVKHISGITTLANGEACLILNISDIISTIGSKKIRSRIVVKNEIARVQDNFKYKILVVDDSRTTRMLQKNILSNQGYNVSTATNPINALDKCKQTKYDMVISDIQMPEMNGFEFIKELRRNQNYEKTPVIVVSSEPKEKYSKEIDETRIKKYIQKNTFRQDEFIHVIENILH